jgi:AAA+ ATPase superfamily predicted ATPase
MNIQNRESKLDELQRIQNLSFSNHSRMTVVLGRRRIGKTSLIIKSVKVQCVYLIENFSIAV